MTNKPPIRVGFTDAFRRALKRLRKKYPHIRDDLQPLIDKLISGEIPGDQIQATGYTVYKVRLPNQDAGRGKSGGYRVIYYVYQADHLILLTIYTKSERSDIDADEIKGLIDSLPED
ncbi:MAG TPA: type II toxin-antitoxin system RelE/ParE family toxin [Phototrophicaceae bacterium]|jgi:mRNA-degrading endonuclease RelE of RelBE toxin-antitoxin system|nr:type II toxin-antitoxin system RelE/ParE family toxin [Phototrophicaceae bacterium]